MGQVRPSNGQNSEAAAATPLAVPKKCRRSRHIVVAIIYGFNLLIISLCIRFTEFSFAYLHTTHPPSQTTPLLRIWYSIQRRAATPLRVSKSAIEYWAVLHMLESALQEDQKCDNERRGGGGAWFQIGRRIGNHLQISDCLAVRG